MDNDINKLFEDTFRNGNPDFEDISKRIKQIRIQLNKKDSEDPYPNTFDGMCPICLESTENGWCILKECKHVFHCNCITEWYNNRILNSFKPKCPKCNKQFFLNEIIPKKYPYITEGPGADQLDFGKSSELTYLHSFK